MSEKEVEKKQTKKVIKYIIIIILSLVVMSGLIYISINLYISYKEKKVYDALAEAMQNVENTESQDEEEEKQEKTEKMINLEELHNENEDIVAWVEIPGTNVNYPILQGDDNSYYINHNYKKKYSASGSIFLDKDVDLQLPSSNFLMYGHRNKNGAMFEDLYKYKDESFYKEHKTINFTTLSEDVEYDIMAVFKSRVYYVNEKNVFRYYFFVNAETKEEYDDYVSNAKKASLYDTGISAEYGEQLITLSTCEYSQTDGRFVVVAKKSV